MNRESKPSSSTSRANALMPARPLGAVALPDVRGQEHPESADVAHALSSSAAVRASSAAVLRVALGEERARRPRAGRRSRTPGPTPSSSAARPASMSSLDRGVDQALRLAHGERPAVGDLRAELAARRATAWPRRHDLVHEADPLGLVGGRGRARSGSAPWPAPAPTTRGSRCVPPLPGDDGQPDLGQARASRAPRRSRMSQHSASSSPPPRALPSIAAIVGIGSAASRLRRSPASSSCARAARRGRAGPRTRPTCDPARERAIAAPADHDRADVAGSAAASVASASPSCLDELAP